MVWGGERWSVSGVTIEAPVMGFSLLYILAGLCLVGSDIVVRNGRSKWQSFGISGSLGV